MTNKSLLILGAGPAGLTAGIYAVRARIPVVMVEKAMPGGNLLITEKIENYPGFPGGIGGMDLARKMETQFRELGGDIIFGEPATALFTPEQKSVMLADGMQLEAGAAVVATGGSRRRLGVEGEERLIGKGVSYCAVCDASFFKGKTVAVVGGGDAALEEALYLTRFASAVHLIHRRDEFRASPSLRKEIRENTTVITHLSSVIERIEGTVKVERVVLKDTGSGKSSELPLDGVFVSIGQMPNTGFVKGLLAMNESGYIVTDEIMATSCPGVFAGGDVRRKTLYQVVTACGDGATAAFSAEKYLSTMKTG